MRKRIYFFTLVLLFVTGQMVNAQVTIGSNDDPKATLDVVASSTDGSTAEGIIPPRLTGDQIATKDSKYGADQKGAIVYATTGITTATPAGSKAASITTEGYYYFDGAAWQALGGGSDVAPVYTVSPELGRDDVDGYVIKPTDIYLALNLTTTGTSVLQLPTDAPVGRVIWVSNIGSRGTGVSVQFRNRAYSGISGGFSGAMISLGGGQWDWVTGLGN